MALPHACWRHAEQTDGAQTLPVVVPLVVHRSATGRWERCATATIGSGWVSKAAAELFAAPELPAQARALIEAAQRAHAAAEARIVAERQAHEDPPSELDRLRAELARLRGDKTP